MKFSNMMNKRISYIFIVGLVCLLFLGILSTTVFCPRGVCKATSDSFKSVGKAGYIVDVATGTVLYSRDEREKLPIASMVKIMTTLLTLEAVDRGEISLGDDVVVSENASSMGGSQVFLDAGSTHKLSQLVKSVVVASANDSCVALAEHISGSVDKFVAKMNARAKELEMNDTLFKNCTGLSQAESFSCAKDVATMFSKLIAHPIYFEYAKVWLEDYKHPDGRLTSMTNTNKLVRFYNGCDGGKTGFTSEAKFCLCATAKKNDMRVIAVVIGADSSKVRNSAVSAMFDYAFTNFSNEIMQKANTPLDFDIEVSGGKAKRVNVGVNRDITRFAGKDDDAKYEIKYEVENVVRAPILTGDIVGCAYLLKDGVVVDKVDVIALEKVDRLTYFDAIGEIAKNWSTIKR